MSLSPGSRLGSYEVLSPLGEGGMGQVWRARDTRLGREVALKVLPEALARDQERLQRFEREAQVLASLNHPGVAAIYGVEDAGGTPALVLEFVEGPTLADRIGAGPMPIAQAVAIARQIAEALEYAHERGVVHRDLKPANVKLDAEGRAKVLDFGLAKAIAGDPAKTGDPSFSPTITSLGTIAGAILGTAAYMSPEQARGANVDRRADIWAFGAVVWEMLSGKRAFEGDTVSDTLAAVLRAPLEWTALPVATPPGVIRLLKRCLERDPKKRLRDIGEARIALETLDAEPPPPISTAAATPQAPRRTWVALLPWVLAGLAVAGLVAALVALNRPAPEAPVVRFEIPAPEKASITNWPKLSPDGRLIAFRARGVGGAYMVWLRPLDSFQAYPLAGTEGAGRPFWSPDGRYLVYTVSNQIKKIPVGGGPSQLIGEAEGASDGTWGSDGTILFDGRASDPIRRIPAAGGPAVVESPADPAKGELEHFWPEFLPDGRHYLLVVTAKSEAKDRTMLHVATLGEPGSKPLTPTDSRAEYANGYIVYVLQNTLVAHRFDADRLALAGDPVPLAPKVTTRQTQADFSLSRNGGIAYLSSQESANSRLVWVDRSGREVGTVGPPDAYRDLALSPDETRLAYGRWDGREGDDIWVRDLKRDVAMRLTSDAATDAWPVWSPDGSRIAFTSNRSTSSFALWIKPAGGTGTEEMLLARDGANLAPCQFSPDGRRLAYIESAAGRPSDVRMLPMDAEHKPEDYLTQQAGEIQPRFSPDGRWVAYTSDESGRNEVYVQTYPASGSKWTISSAGGSEPYWRADGKELFFRGLDDTIYALPVTLGATLEAGVPKPLFKHALETSGLPRSRWQPSGDGQRFLLNASVEAARPTPFSVVLDWPATLK